MSVRYFAANAIRILAIPFGLMGLVAIALCEIANSVDGGSSIIDSYMRANPQDERGRE